MTSNTNSPVSPSSRTTFPHVHRSSPRSSIDGHSPVSPFLQNLSHRWRKASSASYTRDDVPASNGSVASPDTAASRGSAASLLQDTTKSRAEASRNAKRYLQSTVKDDWAWTPQSGGGVEMRNDAVRWESREEGMSDLETEREQRRRSKMQRYSQEMADPYKFEDPDAVGRVMDERRRKKRKMVTEECQWNVGLREWGERRDVWTGAKLRGEKRRGGGLGRVHERNESAGTEGSGSLSVGSEERGGESTDSLDDGTGQQGEDGTVLLPIYPSLFPEDNLLRSRIQPSAYPTIYSKVVIQSLTPNIPIPLTHMTKILVEGWKSEGNWPPSGTPQLQQASALGAAKTARKNSAFLRWRKEKEGGARDKVRRGLGFVVKKAVGLDKLESEKDLKEKELEVAGDKDVGIDFREAGSEEDDGSEEERQRESSRVY